MSYIRKHDSPKHPVPAVPHSGGVYRSFWGIVSLGPGTKEERFQYYNIDSFLSFLSVMHPMHLSATSTIYIASGSSMFSSRSGSLVALVAQTFFLTSY